MLGVSERNNKVEKSQYLKNHEFENFSRIAERQSTVVKKKKNCQKSSGKYQREAGFYLILGSHLHKWGIFNAQVLEHLKCKYANLHHID